MKANPAINQQLVSCLRVALEQHSLELLVSSRNAEAVPDDNEDSNDEVPKKHKLTLEEKAIFLEGDALQIEMGNIVMRTTASNVVVYDVAVATSIRAGTQRSQWQCASSPNWRTLESDVSCSQRMPVSAW